MQTIRSSLVLSLLATLAIASSHLFAATIYWDGDTDSVWGTATNWDGDTLPSSTDEVIFDTNTNFATNGTQVNIGSSIGVSSITVDLAAFRLNTTGSRSITLGSTTSAGAFILTSKFTTDSTVFDSNNNRAISVEFYHNLSLINRGAGTAFVGTDTSSRMASVQGKSDTTGASVITFGGSGDWTFRTYSYLGKHASNTAQTLAVVLTGSGPDAFTGTLEYGSATAASVDALTIDSGAFRLKNASVIASAGVTVGADGTLAGAGSVNGSAAIAGRLAAGFDTGRGQLSFSQNLTLASSATTALRIESDNTNDSLLGSAGGVFTQSGALVIDGADAIATEGQWTLFSGFGSIEGAFASVTLSGLGSLAWNASSHQWNAHNLGGLDWNFDAASGLLTATSAIPEPAAITLLLGGLSALTAALLRRRRSRA